MVGKEGGGPASEYKSEKNVIIYGQTGGAVDFVLGRGTLVLLYVSIFKTLRILWRIQKWVKDTKKKAF